MYQNKITKLIAVILIAALLGSVAYYFSGTELFQGKIFRTQTKKPETKKTQTKQKKITVIKSFNGSKNFKEKYGIFIIAPAIKKEAEELKKELKKEKCNVGDTVYNWTYGMLQKEFKNEQEVITKFIGCLSSLTVDELDELEKATEKAFKEANDKTVRLNIQLLLSIYDLTKNLGKDKLVLSHFKKKEFIELLRKEGFPSDRVYFLKPENGAIIRYDVCSAPEKDGVYTGEKCVDGIAIINTFTDPAIRRRECPLAQRLENGKIEYEGNEYYVCPSDCPDETGSIRPDSLAAIQGTSNERNSEACGKNKDSDKLTKLTRGLESCFAGRIDIPEDDKANVIACIDPNTDNLNKSKIISVERRGCLNAVDEAEDASAPEPPPDASPPDAETPDTEDAGTRKDAEVPDAVFEPEVPPAKNNNNIEDSKAGKVIQEVIAIYDATNATLESKTGIKVGDGIEVPVVNTTIKKGEITFRVSFGCPSDSGNCPSSCSELNAQILENKNCSEIKPETFIEKYGISPNDRLINPTDKSTNIPSCLQPTNKNNACNNVDCGPGYKAANFETGECCGVSVQELEQKFPNFCLTGQGGACGDAPDKF